MGYEDQAGTIKEESYVLTSKVVDREKEIAISGKNTLFWDEYSRFWQTAFVKGRECWDYVVGDYFSSSELDDYDFKEKAVINIPGLINKVNTLESMQLTGRRNGVVIPVGADDAPDRETINYVLGAIQRSNNVPDEKTAAFTDGVVTGYPQFMWFNKDMSWDNARHLEVYHEHWDAVLPDPYWSRQDLSDCRRLVRVRLMTKQEMMVAYPKRRDVIDRDIHEGTHPKDYFAQQTFSSDERDRLYEQINSAQDSFNQTGKMYVIESLFFVYVETEVWWDQSTGDYTLMPPEWTVEQQKVWIESNPNLKQIKRHVRCLWTTASAQSGTLLENNKHWFQKNEYPCEMYIPKVWNNKPRGIIEFLRGTTKAEAIARIEHLHSLRQVNDDLVLVKENSISNAQDLNREVSRTGGKIVVRDDIPISEAIQFPLAGKRENMGWMEFANDMMVNTDRLSTNPNMEGIAQSSQESAKVVEARNRAGTKKFTPYMNTYHQFDLRITRKMLMMIPYVITAQTIVRHVDGKNNPVEVELNKVVERDLMNGDPTRIVNNLQNAKYDYVPAVTDDSVTAREFEVNQFLEVIRESLPNVPQEYWPDLLDSMGNGHASKFAEKLRKIQEQMAQQEPPKDPIKVSLSINSEDIMNNPMVQAILKDQEILTEEMLAKPGAQQQVPLQPGGPAQGGPPPQSQQQVPTGV